MSQYLSLLTAFVAYWIQHPEKAAALWALIVRSYEASQAIVSELVTAFEYAAPREAGIALTDEEQDAEEQFARLAGAPRGPFGNGKILRWLLTTEEGKALLALLKSNIPGIGS